MEACPAMDDRELMMLVPHSQRDRRSVVAGASEADIAVRAANRLRREAGNTMALVSRTALSQSTFQEEG